MRNKKPSAGGAAKGLRSLQTLDGCYLHPTNTATNTQAALEKIRRRCSVPPSVVLAHLVAAGVAREVSA
jgi:hypothetical protein